MRSSAFGPTGVRSVSRNRGTGKGVAKVEMLGVGEVNFTQDAGGLTINLPEKKPYDYTYGFRITPT